MSIIPGANTIYRNEENSRASTTDQMIVNAVWNKLGPLLYQDQGDGDYKVVEWEDVQDHTGSIYQSSEYPAITGLEIIRYVNRKMYEVSPWTIKNVTKGNSGIVDGSLATVDLEFTDHLGKKWKIVRISNEGDSNSRHKKHERETSAGALFPKSPKTHDSIRAKDTRSEKERLKYTAIPVTS